MHEDERHADEHFDRRNAKKATKKSADSSAIHHPLTGRRRGPGILGRRPLSAVVDDDDAGADEFCAATENPAEPNIIDNDSEAKSIVQGLCDPTMLLRDKTEMNSAMIIRHGVMAARIGGPADELKCLARSQMFIRVTPAINPIRRFTA